ncbi:MAG: DUF177 domain-containing protein [Pyrinomonadaceae bacterium]|nr:DUF177 domain-containing protein [Pyrinomonadaceae bacterium]
MYIDLTKLSEGRKDFDETIQVDLDEESVRLLEPCRIFGELKKGIVQVDVAGKIIAKVEMECSRCLTPVESTLEISFKVSYITEEHYTNEKDSELHGEELEISIYDGEKIDLTDLAREQILLNLPAQTFCSENCQGLCPKCGANLNQKTCDCETKEIDPRWANLKNLRF